MSHQRRGESPVGRLLERIREELGGAFDLARPICVGQAPGRLDVMGGIADYTGSMVCEMPLSLAAAVAVQARDDRRVQVFSFNLLDEGWPFTLGISLDALAEAKAEELRKDFEEPGRKWGAYVIGCLFVLHERGYLDLKDGNVAGMNLAVESTVPMGAGLSSSAAIEIATMMALMEQFGLRERVEPMRVAEMAQDAENRIAGAPCGIMDQVTSLMGEEGKLLRMVCQPHEVLPALGIPEGMQFVGINSGVKHSVGGAAYRRTRCAAFMGHAMILERMREMGRAAGKELTGDPMKGYLANLEVEDYKRFFRPFLPAVIRGEEFLKKYGATIDRVTRVETGQEYAVLGAVDHHVLEARRVRNFSAFLEEAGALPAGSRDRGKLLDQAAHLMYASHLSYTNDAGLGAEECDWIVDAVKQREREGLYGARITGGGAGGTVALLAEATRRADYAIEGIMEEYRRSVGRACEVVKGTGEGAIKTNSR